jgi:uncharacterized membrane protein YkoI
MRKRAIAALGRRRRSEHDHVAGKFLYNVDVGSHDVKVDAVTGDVVAVDQDG